MKMIQKYFDEIIPSEMRSRFVDDVQVIDINPAARWFLAENERDDYQIHVDFPRVVSPWPTCWMEFEHPGIEKSGNTITHMRRANSGALLMCIPIPEPERLDALRNHALCRLIGNEPHVRILEDTTRAIERGFEPAWMQYMNIYWERNERANFMFTACMYLDADGRIDSETWFNLGNPDFPGITDGFPFAGMMFPYLFALSLLHCKNVHLEDATVAPKTQKAREKQGVPNIAFKTLVVEPMRQQVRREASEDPTGERSHIKRAMHIARGHFKDYRNGPGLFGKFQGLYWWDMHVRGNADSGTIIKDYLVRQ